MKLKPTEHDEQVALFQWAALHEQQEPALRLLYAIPNGGLRHPVVANKLRDEGVKSGVPDICLPVSRFSYHSLYIELKTKEGKPTKAQMAWIADLLEEGNKACVAYGWENAKAVIEAYLTMRKNRQ